MRNFPRSGYLIHEEFSTKWVSYPREMFSEAVIHTHRNFQRSGYLIHGKLSAKRLFLFMGNYPRSGYSHPQEFLLNKSIWWVASLFIS